MSSVVPRTDRAWFNAQVPKQGLSLEIGALDRPWRHPKHHTNRILDVYDKPGLIRRYHGDPNVNPANIVDVDYRWEGGGQTYADLIPHERFDFALSSHNIEHQPDLVWYLRNLSSVLRPGGKIYFVIPDHRYCFDHFRTESELSQVLAAHIMSHRAPTVADLLDHHLMTAHNDPVRHWKGVHGAPAAVERADLTRSLYAELKKAMDDGTFAASYRDCHVWKFTPASFGRIVTALHELGLVDLRLEMRTDTLRGSNEFYAVLAKA